MRIDQEIKLDYQDVLIRPKRSTLTSRKEVQLERTFKFPHSNKTWTGIPIMSANMNSSGTFSMAKELSKHKIITCLHKFYPIEELEEKLPELNEANFIAYTLGIRDEDFEKINIIKSKGLEKYFNFICLDVPNGYLERFTEKLRELRKLFPDHIIIAGNIVTNEMAEELILQGADIAKVGIGPGAACTTRLKTGIGYPQLSASIECADAAHGITTNKSCGLIVADGGIVHSSCIAKAFCGGADFVMIGSMFAGYEESGGEIVEMNGKQFKSHYGSSSAKALMENYGKKEKHRASEGRETLIPYKGEIKYLIEDIFGSLRSTGTYIGARKLKEFSKRTTFIIVNQQLNTSIAKYDNG